MTDDMSIDRIVHVRLELELEVTDPVALMAAALRRVREREYSDPAEAADEEALVASSIEEAALAILEPDEMLEGSEGVELGAYTIGVGEPDRLVTPAPLSDASPQQTVVENLVTKLIADASRLPGIDEFFTSEDEFRLMGADEAVRVLRQETLVRGMLWHASTTLIDYLFEDLRTLNSTKGNLETEIPHTFVLSGLPARFARHYDVLFAQKFLVSAVDITARLATGWQPASSVAQELAIRCLLDEAEASADLFDLDLPRGWRATLEDHLFEDTDHEYLFNAEFEEFENEPERTPGGMAPMGIEHWFVRFNDGYELAPYAEDPEPKRDLSDPSAR